jgi:hypothetical protein
VEGWRGGGVEGSLTSWPQPLIYRGSEMPRRVLKFIQAYMMDNGGLGILVYI